MLDIKTLLRGSMRRAGSEEKIESFQAVGLFNGLVEKFFGENLAKKIQAMHIEDRILTVASLSSMARVKIQSEEEKIIQEINNNFNSEVVEKIEYLT